MNAPPYDLYIRYLATTGMDDIKAVNADLKLMGLRSVEQSILDRHWDLIQSTLPQRVINTIGRKNYTPEFLRHMKVLDIDEMWRSLPQFKDNVMRTNIKLVYDIFQDITLKLTVNALLLKGLKLEEISRLVTTKFSIPITEKQLALYSKYFFNTKTMTRGSWKEYIRQCADTEKRIYFTALTENAEVLKTELDLPAIANVGESLQWLLTKSFLKARTFMDVGTPDADLAAMRWSDQVVKLADKYEKYRSGDQNDFAKTLQMEFDFIDEPFDDPDSETYREVSQKNAPKE